MGITAYEFIVYLDEQDERLEKLKLGEITKEQWEEEEAEAKENMRKKKKSSIVHKISDKNKQAYREKILAYHKALENDTARDQQRNNELPQNEEFDSHQVFKLSRDSRVKESFDNIIHDPNYSKNPNEMNSKSKLKKHSNKRQAKYMVADGPNEEENKIDEERGKEVKQSKIDLLVEEPQSKVRTDSEQILVANIGNQKEIKGSESPSKDPRKAIERMKKSNSSGVSSEHLSSNQNSEKKSKSDENEAESGPQNT